MAIKQRKSLTLDEEIIKKVEEFPAPSKEFSFKVNNMLKELLDMVSLTKRELINFFTESEAEFICEVMKNATTATTISQKALLKAAIESMTALDPDDIKIKADKEIVLNKIDKLTEFQCYVVLKTIQRYWEKPDRGLRETFLIRN